MTPSIYSVAQRLSSVILFLCARILTMLQLFSRLLAFFVSLFSPPATPRDRDANRPPSRNFSELPYRTNTFLLSAAERSLFQVLRHIAGPNYLLFAQVRLCDVIGVPQSPSWRTHFNRISTKHLDFLLCDHETRPLVAIELDDSSHRRPDRRQRDSFLNAALLGAGLPLLRVPASHHYDASALRLQLQQLLLASQPVCSPCKD